MEASDSKDLHPGDSFSSPVPAKSFSGVFSSSPTSSLSFLPSDSEDSGTSSSSDFCSASGENSMAEAVASRWLMEAVAHGDLDRQGKEKCVGRHDMISCGSSSVIGRRKEMEDVLAVVHGFMSRACSHVGGCTASFSGSSGQISPVHFFGVYDGHGGSEDEEDY